MTKHRSPDERADQILSAARHCFLENGYFATRMDEIAEKSGLSKGGIYFHFDSKKDIFRSLVEQEYETAMELVAGVIDSGSDIQSMIVDLGRHFTERFEETDSARFFAIIAEMALRDEEIRQMLLELQENYIDRLALVLSNGVEQGQLKDIDPEAAALLLKSIIDGIRAGYGIGYEPEAEQLIETSLRILGTGLLSEESELVDEFD